jgi:hypothetical protein
MLIASIASISLFAGGIALNAEYVFRAIPLQALAEVAHDQQIGLTALLHGLGASNSLALALGSISYVIMVLVGLLAGKIAADRFCSNAFLLAVPAAAAVLGGPYVRPTDVIAVIPLAVLLASQTNANRILLAVAISCLIAPWWRAFDHPACRLRVLVHYERRFALDCERAFPAGSALRIGCRIRAVECCSWTNAFVLRSTGDRSGVSAGELGPHGREVLRNELAGVVAAAHSRVGRYCRRHRLRSKRPLAHRGRRTGVKPTRHALRVRNSACLSPASACCTGTPNSPGAFSQRPGRRLFQKYDAGCGGNVTSFDPSNFGRVWLSTNAATSTASRSESEPGAFCGML